MTLFHFHLIYIRVACSITWPNSMTQHFHSKAAWHNPCSSFIVALRGNGWEGPLEKPRWMFSFHSTNLLHFIYSFDAPRTYLLEKRHFSSVSWEVLKGNIGENWVSPVTESAQPPLKETTLLYSHREDMKTLFRYLLQKHNKSVECPSEIEDAGLHMDLFDWLVKLWKKPQQLTSHFQSILEGGEVMKEFRLRISESMSMRVPFFHKTIAEMFFLSCNRARGLLFLDNSYSNGLMTCFSF